MKEKRASRSAARMGGAFCGQGCADNVRFQADKSCYTIGHSKFVTAFQILVYRSVRYSFVGRGHDPADHLNNDEMFVFCAILAVCKSLLRSKKFNRIGGVMTPPYEYVV